MELAAHRASRTDGRFALDSEMETIDAPDEPVYVRDSEGRYATYTDERIRRGRSDARLPRDGEAGR